MKLIIRTLGMYTAHANAQIAVHWNHTILPDLGTLADLDNAFTKTGVSPYKLELKDPKGDVKSPSNCTEYLQLKGQDYRPGSTYAITMEAFFVQRCDTLEFIKSARASRKTLFKQTSPDKSVAELPSCFGEIGGDSGFWKMNNDQTIRGDSLAKQPWLVMWHPPYLKLKGEGEERAFASTAYGDINGDGIEDAMIFSQTEYEPHATARMFESYEVTRIDPTVDTFKILKQTGEMLNGAIYGCPQTY